VETALCERVAEGRVGRVSGWLRGGWGELREWVCWSRLFEGARKICGSEVTWAAEASNAATKSTFSTNPCVETPLQQSVKHAGGGGGVNSKKQWGKCYL
jgi:hypothetical protein